MSKLIRGAVAALFLTMVSAQAAPVDCSKAPIPDTPVRGTVNGQPFVPKEIRIDITADGMEIDDAKFDKFALSLITDGIFNEATLDMLVPLGKPIDGRTYRVLPFDQISAQPAAAPGTPEVQGWDIELQSAHVDTNFTQTIASIRVIWGKRKADSIDGKIYYCVPSVKAEIMGAFTATIHGPSKGD
ncbi:MAG TPA: hypothetical protein VGU69_16730 [Rhizomicrobium sp.]|nr:hypothetical protein [Rhizomicrobium sp.]